MRCVKVDVGGVKVLVTEEETRGWYRCCWEVLSGGVEAFDLSARCDRGSLAGLGSDGILM